MTWGCPSTTSTASVMVCLYCNHDADCRSLVAARRPVLCEDGKHNPKHHGARLLRLLSASDGMTAKELASLADLDRSYVSAWCIRNYARGTVRIAGTKLSKGITARIYAVVPPGDAMTARTDNQGMGAVVVAPLDGIT